MSFKKQTQGYRWDEIILLALFPFSIFKFFIAICGVETCLKDREKKFLRRLTAMSDKTKRGIMQAITLMLRGGMERERIALYIHATYGLSDEDVAQLVQGTVKKARS